MVSGALDVDECHEDRAKLCEEEERVALEK